MLCISKGFSMDTDRKKDSLDRKGKEREFKEQPERQQKNDKEGPGRFTSFIYNSIKARPRNPEEEQRALRRENDYMSRFAGRTIGEIHVYRNNVFEGSNRWVDRTLNSMHYPTREKQIRNDLLFHTGDTLDPVEIRNNRRLLRSRDYISDVNILAVPRPEDTTIVDMYVLTKDKWTISADLDIDSDGPSSIEIYDDNFLGLGDRFSIRTYLDWKHAFRYGGNLVEYSMPNIGGTFWDGRVVAGQGFDNSAYGIELKKEFIRPTDYGAGASFMYKRDLIDIFPPDTSIHARWTILDLWGGRAFAIPALRNSLYFTARFFNLHYTDRPEVSNTLNPYFHSNSMVIGSIGFYKERFQLASLIYGYGVPEDIAYGYRTAFLTGYSWGEFGNRWYFGGEFSAGYFTRIGYFGIGAGLGSYLNQSGGQFYQTTLSARITYFTNLMGTGRYPIRQFLTLNATRGWNRLDGFRETLEFNSMADLRGMKEDVYGTNRMVLNTETVVFTPWHIAQFKMAMFGFADFGLIGDNGNIFKNNFYATVGLGIRIKNEHLIFNTISIRLGVALNKNGFMDSHYFNLSNRDRNNPIRYIPVKAAPIDYL